MKQLQTSLKNKKSYLNTDSPNVKKDLETANKQILKLLKKRDKKVE